MLEGISPIVFEMNAGDVTERRGDVSELCVKEERTATEQLNPKAGAKLIHVIDGVWLQSDG
jgi:hypothetical protein